MRSLLSIFLCLLYMSGYASLPVIDFGAIAGISQQIKHMREQYGTMLNSYKTAKNQLTTLESLKKYNAGSYKWGELLNAPNDFKERKWSPESWKDALKSVSGANASRYQQLTSEYESAHKVLSNNDYAKGASSKKTDMYGESKAVNRAISVNATYAFNDIQKHLDNVNEITKKIEKTENTKSALDLNSRLLSEIAYIQTENLKMQVLLNQGSALKASEHLSNESESSSFNRLPDM